MAEFTYYWLTDQGWIKGLEEVDSCRNIRVVEPPPEIKPVVGLVRWWYNNDWGPDDDGWGLTTPWWLKYDQRKDSRLEIGTDEVIAATYDWEAVRAMILRHGAAPYSPEESPLRGLLHERWGKGDYSFCTGRNNLDKLIWEGNYPTREEARAAGQSAYDRRKVNGIMLLTRKNVPLTWDDLGVTIPTVRLSVADEMRLPFISNHDSHSNGDFYEYGVMREGAKYTKDLLIASGPCPYVWHVFHAVHIKPQGVHERRNLSAAFKRDYDRLHP
jgi:hypothetical protein